MNNNYGSVTEFTFSGLIAHHYGNQQLFDGGIESLSISSDSRYIVVGTGIQMTQFIYLIIHSSQAHQ